MSAHLLGFEQRSSNFDPKDPKSVPAWFAEAARRRRTETRTVRVGLLGYGRVGQAVASLAWQERERLAAAGVAIRCVGALVRDIDKPRGGPAVPLSSASSPTKGADILVEVMGGIEPARSLVSAALRAGIPVVSANKTLVAAHGEELTAIARRHGASFAYDAAVLAGVPFLGALSRRPFASGCRRLSGIINGTSQFILSEMAKRRSFDDALAEAIERGYAEPDHAADTSGRDAAEKLTILLHLAGIPGVRATDLPKTGLSVLDPQDFADARALEGVIKPIATASFEVDRTGAWVGPGFVPVNHAFASLGGVANVIEISGLAELPVTFAGPGAGPEVTAATILDDVVEIVHGRNQPPIPAPHIGKVDGRALSVPAPGRWFVRVSGQHASAANDVLNRAGLTVTASVNALERFAALTTPAPWATVKQATEILGANALVIPVLEK